MNLKSDFLNKVEQRSATIGVVGLGYVGLPLAVAFAEEGFKVIGVDVSAEKVDSLNDGISYIEDVASEILAPLVGSGALRASTDYAALADVDAISICVPTPLLQTREPDISYIISATDSVVAHGIKSKLIVLESTTYPGTTEEIMLPRLAAAGGAVGEDFFLAFSPERIDPGRTDFTMFTTPKVIGGTTPDCTEVAVALYGTVVEQPVPVSGTKSAEMVKLLENIFRAVNIGFVNELAIMCQELNLNVWEIIDAAATKPYGFMPFYPGPGIGGHCIPIDPYYLSWKMKQAGFNSRFIQTAMEVNEAMPRYVVNRVADALNDVSRSLRGSQILVLGAAYKPNVSDVRESPTIPVMELLLAKGAQLQYHDPYVADLQHEGIDLFSVELTDEVLSSADCVLVLTNHNSYDWEHIASTAKLIVDTRNAVKSTACNVVGLSAHAPALLTTS